MVARWDGHIWAGRVDSRIALNLDRPATLARVAGAPMPTDGLVSYATDPYETQNLARRADYREVLRHMRQRALATCRPTPPEYSW